MSFVTSKTRDWKTTAIVIVIAVSVAVCLVTRFVDFSHSRITSTQVRPVHGKRAASSAPVFGTAGSAIYLAVEHLSEIPTIEALPSQAFHKNLHNRPPPSC
jgi:hypothetical protein